MRNRLDFYVRRGVQSPMTRMPLFYGVKVYRAAFFLLVSFFCYGVSLADVVSSNKPQRIASLNLCLDELLLQLVEPDRIVSLTYLSGNRQFSPFAEQAQHYYLNRGLAEDLAPLNPDVILAGEFGAADAKHLLTQLGFRVESLALPRNLVEITAHIRHFGQLVGSELAAEKMARHIEQQLQLLDSVQQKNKRVINAYWYSSNGVVVGGDTLENELMELAGIHNLAVDKHLQGFAQLDLETLLLSHPDVLIMEATDVAAFSLAHEYVEHPAIASAKIKIIKLPAHLSNCSASVVVDVINALIREAEGYNT